MGTRKIPPQRAFRNFGSATGPDRKIFLGFALRNFGGDSLRHAGGGGREGAFLIVPSPLPPPVVLVCAGGRLTATGGGILYTLIPKGDCIPLWEPPCWTALSVGYRRHLPRGGRQVLAPLWGPPFGASLRRDDSVIRGARFLRPGTVRFCEASSFIPFHIL